MQQQAAGLARNRNDRAVIVFSALTLALAVWIATNIALAGTGGSEFAPLYTTLIGWMTGYLGRVVAVVFILVGVIAGATRGSVMGFVIGIAAGVGMFLAPDVIDATVSATLPVI